MKLFANIVSAFLHPLLILTYILLIYMVAMPIEFGNYTIGKEQSTLILMIFLITFLIPFIGILVMKPLDFIQSYQMKDKKERIPAYIVVMMIYIWMCYQFTMVDVNIPKPYFVAFFGATIAICLGFIINLFEKISLHTIGMGGVLGMFISLFLFWDISPYTTFLISGIQFNLLLIFKICLVLAGLVGTSRLYLNAHSNQQIYLGYFVGFIAQFIAYYFYINMIA